MSASDSELTDAIYRNRLHQAEEMTAEQRILAGPRLFDAACAWTKAGIRAERPDLSDDDLMRVLRERLLLAERLERGR